MCTTTRAAGARLRASAADVPSAAQDVDCVAKAAPHSDAHERALVDGVEEADWAEPVRRLPLWELVTDAAVVIFVLMHVVAAATPWWAGGVTRKDVALVVASYTARMFGAHAPRASGEP